MCSESRELNEGLLRKILASLCQHGLYIYRHLSVYSSPYNHLIGEATALYLIGDLCYFFEESEKWRDRGWQILENQCEKQFYSDGLTVEQATFYHHFTLGFFLLAVLHRRCNGEEIPEGMLERIKQAVAFSMHMTKPDGTVPMVGDIDNARSLYFSSKHSWDFRGYLGVGAILFEEPEFKFLCSRLPEEVFWLFSVKDIQEFLNMSEITPSKKGKLFAESGYFFYRDQWGDEGTYLSFDFGEIAHGLHSTGIPSAAHGHADGLAFEFSAFGENFFADGGFYTYFGHEKWHKHFRLEEAHNTMRIERQAKYAGRLTWQNVKRPKLTIYNNSGEVDSIGAKIDYDDGLEHERRIVRYRDRIWIINDIVFSTKKGHGKNLRTYLSFHPSVNLELEKDKNIIRATAEKAAIIVGWFRDAKIEARKGGKKPSDGWVAEGYGIKKPAWRVTFEWVGNNKVQNYPLIIMPFRTEQDAGSLNINQYGKNGEMNATYIGPDKERHYRIAVGLDTMRIQNDEERVTVSKEQITWDER